MREDPNPAGFSDDEARALAGILDELIPPRSDGAFPGAGEIGLAGYIDQKLRESPELRPVVLQGLAAVAAAAGRRNSAGFAALSAPERVEVLNEVAAAEPALLPMLTFHTFTGYYQDARVVEALGLEARPPYPVGYEMEPSDLDALLEPVRQRPKLFREG